MDGIASAPVQPGSVLAGRYRLESLIGRGGMASVYRANDEVLGRAVAVKVFSDPAGDRSHAERATTEVRLLASLNHHSLVTLFDAHVDADDDAYLVMELVDGPTLRDRIIDGPIAPSDIATMASDLAEALHAVHSAGMVHRDVKPSNVLLGPSTSPSTEFRAKLADFGIAHLIDSARLTTPGTIMGTAAYLSPEQTRGSSPAPAGDVYSLGLVLLECFTRERAFPGTMTESLVARVQRDPVIPGDIGYAWKSLLTAMTARNAQNRPSALEVAEAARRLVPVAPSPTTLAATATTTAAMTRTTPASAPPASALAPPATAEPMTAPVAEVTELLTVAGPGAAPLTDLDATEAHPVAWNPVASAPVGSEVRGTRRARRASPSAATGRSSRRRRAWAIVAAASVVAVALGAGAASWITGGQASVSASDVSSTDGIAAMRETLDSAHAGFEAVLAASATEPSDDASGETATDATESEPAPGPDPAPAPSPSEDTDPAPAPSPSTPVEPSPSDPAPEPEQPAPTNPGNGNGNGNGNGGGGNGKGPGTGNGQG